MPSPGLPIDGVLGAMAREGGGDASGGSGCERRERNTTLKRLVVSWKGQAKMSHYEKRLEEDLRRIMATVKEVGSKVEAALEMSLRALLRRDRHLASATILGDLPINRQVRSCDKMCHVFVARHLPSAGHLRFVSSVLRLNVGLERLGDYAVTISREALQLEREVPPLVARDIELLSEQALQILGQALDSFYEKSPDLARGTKGLASHLQVTFDKVFQDLLEEGVRHEMPIKDLFALMGVLSRLNRVKAQAKNICEETIFTATGETKAPKVYRLLFLDETNECQSKMAELAARKAYPCSGKYASAGWSEVSAFSLGFVEFMNGVGIELGDEGPRRFEPDFRELSKLHVLVSFCGDVRPRLSKLPYELAVVEWDLEEVVKGLEGRERFAALYKEISYRVRELMETLRGEEAS